MLYKMKLHNEPFLAVKSNSKTIEMRLNDEKRRLINVGDTIRFIKIPDMDEYLYADVHAIEVFKNWYDCYEKYFDDDFKERYDSIQDVVDDTYSGGYYTKEDSDKYGCCCLTLSKVRKNR